MLIGELDCHCGNCNIIDYCNDPEDTPLCAQARLASVTTDRFIKLAETSKRKSKNAIINDVYRMVQKEATR